MRYVSIPTHDITARLYAGLFATITWGKRFTEDHGFFVRATGAALFATAAVYWTGGMVYLNTIPSTSPASSASFANTPSQGLTIAANGLAYVQGARVMSVSDSRIVAVSEWNGNSFRWTVRLNADSKIVLADGEVGVLGDVSRGDFVAVSGGLSGGSSNLAIEADTVRLYSSGTEAAAGTTIRLQEFE